MAASTRTALDAEALVIKNETTTDANTATRVGTMLENIIDSVDVIVPFERELTQAEVRTLNSANGGYGINLITGVANNVMQITNPLLIFKGTGGSYATADIWIYDDVNNAASYKATTSNAASTSVTFIEQPELEASNYLGIAGDVYVYSSVEQSSFEGTWVVKFDYKLIDIS